VVLCAEAGTEEIAAITNNLLSKEASMPAKTPRCEASTALSGGLVTALPSNSGKRN